MRALSASFRRGTRQDSIPNQLQPDTQPAPAPTSTPALRLAKSRSISLFSKAPKQPLETSPSVPFLARVSGGNRPDLTPASSASSDGSSSLRTPEDEGLMAFPSPASKADDKKKWPTWLPSWRRPGDRDASNVSDHSLHPPPHGPHRTLGISTQTVHQSSPRSRRSQSDTEEDSSEDEYDDDDDAPTPVGRPVALHVPTRAQVLQAQANVRTLLRNSLIPLASPPPLVDGAQYSFPRSSTPLHVAQRIPSLEQLLHTRRSLQRLDRRPLTLAEARSIAPLANRPKVKPAGRLAAFGIERNKALDVESVADVTMRVGHYSRGLRRWATRPCFEQRFRVWQPDASGKTIVLLAVTGVERSVAICDLEYSEWVEQLAGLSMGDDAFENAISRSFNTLPRKHSPPRNSPRRNTFNRHPSPLRVERASPAEPVVSPVSSTSAAISTRETAGAPLPMLDLDLPKPLSLGATFDAKVADSPTSSAGESSSTSKEDGDNVPLEYLGYALLAKKRKEEKERFLAAEREKRELNWSLQLAEEAKRKMEADRRRAEEDARREEKQKAFLAEEIAAVRRRREHARLGIEAYDNIREMNRRNKGETYARPAYDISPQPAVASRRASGYFPSPESPLEQMSNTPPDSKEKIERRKSTVPPLANDATGKPLSNAPQNRPSASRHSSTPRPIHQQELIHRPDSVISSASSVNVRRATLVRSTSVPLMPQQMAPVAPYPMMPMQSIPPVPAIPVWNMNMGMGVPSLPPLMMPSAPFMMQYSGSPSPVSGTGSAFKNSGSSDSRSRSGSRSRDQRTDQPPSRRQSAAPAGSHSHHPQQQFSNNVLGAQSVAGSARSRHSIYSQAAAVNGSGSYVSLNRSSSHLAPVSFTGANSSASRSPAKRMSMLGPQSQAPHPSSLPHSSSNSQRRSVYGNAMHSSHSLAAQSPHTKRSSTMM